MGALQEQTADADKSNLLTSRARLARYLALRAYVALPKMSYKEEIMDSQSLDFQESEVLIIYTVSAESLEAAPAILRERVGSFTL